MLRRPGLRASSPHSRPVALSAALLSILARAAWLVTAAEAQPPPANPPRDTLLTRLEVGASADYTNEVYYLDALVDTTFLKRQRFQTPQARFAGVLLNAVEGTRDQHRTSYSLTNELSYGDLLRRDALWGSWRTRFAPAWYAFVTPGFEYRWDRTLGRDLEEYRGAGSARIRREGGPGGISGELGALGEWVHTAGGDAEFLLDRRVAGAQAALDHLGTGGGEWRLDYIFRARTFPDSAERNHFEHDTELHTRWGLPGASSFTLDAEAVRRVTREPAPTSADNFWLGHATGELVALGFGRWSWPTHVEFEVQRYDVQDSLLYFDYDVFRAQTGPRFSPRPSWSVGLGPRGEWLSAGLNPGETYRELAGVLQFDLIDARSFWTITTALGRRTYQATNLLQGDAVSLHSDYSFGELDLFADQALARRWRLRALADVRIESHDESIDNGTSLYFSLDLRRLF
jgi:hypothetical protein